MLTVALYLVLALAVGGVLFFLSVAVFGGGAPDDPARAADAAAPERSDLVQVAADAVPVGLRSDGPIAAADLQVLRLPVALRGYRMDATDEVLDRLAQELLRRDEQIAQLRAELDVRLGASAGASAGASVGASAGAPTAQPAGGPPLDPWRTDAVHTGAQDAQERA
jgi:hypothetical protein